MAQCEDKLLDLYLREDRLMERDVIVCGSHAALSSLDRHEEEVILFAAFLRGALNKVPVDNAARWRVHESTVRVSDKE